MLVSQDVGSAFVCLHCLDAPNVHTVAHVQAQLVHIHGQVLWHGVSRGVKLSARSPEEEVGSVAQQRVPVVAHVELSILCPSVDLVNADERPVPGKPGHNTERMCFRSRLRAVLFSRVISCAFGTTGSNEMLLLLKEAAWSSVPLQDDVVSFCLVEEEADLQS